MRYYLEPFGNGANILSKVYLNSTVADENRAAQPPASFILGRNEFTGLADAACPNYQFVSRRHVQVSFRLGKVYIHPLASQEGVVYLNGEPCSNIETELRENEFFSMLGIKQYYNYILKTDDKTSVQPPSPPHVVDLLNTSEVTAQYNIPQSSSNGGNKRDTLEVDNRTTLSQGQSSQSHPVVRTQSLGKANNTSTGNLNNSVEILELDNSATDITVPQSIVPAPIPAPVEPAIDPVEAEKKIMKVVVGKLLRQYECSICYETLACAVSLHPCGCCFCYNCIADWATENKKTGSAAGDASVECPLCMAGFVLGSALSNRMVDSAIREVLENLPEDLAAWEERMKKGTERRRSLEVSGSGKSSSSSLSSMAAVAPAPSAAAPHWGAQAAAPSALYSGRASHNLAALSGRAPREVVELLDSQPDPWGAFRAPPPPARPTGIQAFFTTNGRSAGGANAGGVGMFGGVPPSASDALTLGRSPVGRKRGRGLRQAFEEEDDDNDRAFKQAINNMPGVATTQAAAVAGSSSGPARRGSGGGAGGVFDLTATTSPPNGRRSAVQAVAAPTVPFPRFEEFYCVMSVAELSARRISACSRCSRALKQTAVGTYPAYRSNPTEPLKPGTRAQWMTRCVSWHCALCVADINAQRRASAPRGVDWRTSTQPRNQWPIAYADLELRDQLDLSDARAWQALLNG